MKTKISVVNKILKKIYRSISKFSLIPSGGRVLFLRMAGVKIGKEVIINEGFTLACDLGYESNVIIEDRVAFGPNVTLVVTSHPNSSYLRELKNEYPHFEIFGKITIKHDSWVGAGAIILPNVIVNEYSIVGAGAVVTRDVAQFSIVIGIPAKVIKKIENHEAN